MKKLTACIFGHKGGIGTAVKEAFIVAGYRIIPVNRQILDLNHPDADQSINSLLTNGQPDVVVNATGVFCNSWQHSHNETMNVNFGSNWSILRHYMNPVNQNKAVRVIMIGSSSYSSGRKLYPLYSASKAALYNLWQGVNEALENSPVRVDIVNPARTLTRMSATGKQVNSELDYLKPQDVAAKIMHLVAENLPGRCVDITLKDRT